MTGGGKVEVNDAGLSPCPACGAGNEPGAEWCGQCFTPFHISPAVEPARRNVVDAAPPAGPSGTKIAAEDDTATWACWKCKNINPVSLEVCARCGAAFTDTPRTSFPPEHVAPEGGPVRARTPSEPADLRTLAHGGLDAVLSSDVGSSLAGSIFERVGRAFRLLGAAWTVVTRDAEMLLYPAASGVITYAGGRWFFKAYFGHQFEAGIFRAENLWAILFAYMLFYIFAFSINTFFQAGVIAMATKRLRGNDPRALDGLRAAGSRVGPLLGWAAINASFGLLMNLVERAGFRRGGPGGAKRAALTVAGVAWSSITFFVASMIVMEKRGPVSGIKRSAQIFKERWGESLVGQWGIALGVSILAVPAVLLSSFIGSLDASLGGDALLLSAALLVALGSAFGGVFNAALYHLTTTGKAPEPFAPEDLRHTFAA